MVTLFEIIKFNNVSYAELTDEHGKRKIELWVDKLKGSELTEQILRDYSHGCINIRTFGMADEDESYLVDTIPKDLFVKVLKTVYSLI